VSAFSLRIDDADDARKAVRTAAILGFISAGLTVLLVALSLSGTGGDLLALFDAWSLIDVVLMVALAWGTLKGNRYAAVGLLALYVLGQVVARIEGGGARGLILAVLFTMMFVRGVRGAFFLHRERVDAELKAQLGRLEGGPGEPLA